MQTEAKQGEALIRQYFPLQVGASWQYRVRVTDRDNKVVAEATVQKRVTEDTGQKKDAGDRKYQRVVTQLVAGANLPVPDQRYRVTNTGVYAAVDGSPGEELLVFPAEPDTNRSWTVQLHQRSNVWQPKCC